MHYKQAILWGLVHTWSHTKTPPRSGSMEDRPKQWATYEINWWSMANRLQHSHGPRLLWRLWYRPPLSNGVHSTKALPDRGDMSSRLSGKPLAQSSELKRTVFFPGYLCQNSLEHERHWYRVPSEKRCCWLNTCVLPPSCPSNFAPSPARRDGHRPPRTLSNIDCGVFHTLIYISFFDKLCIPSLLLVDDDHSRWRAPIPSSAYISHRILWLVLWHCTQGFPLA